jgi:DNA-directed RNA polymerase specialized sigma subunit
MKERDEMSMNQPKSKNGKFVKLSLNEKIRREYAKNPNRAEVAKKLGVSYQRVNNVRQSMKLAILPIEFFAN